MKFTQLAPLLLIAVFAVGCTQPYHEELRIDIGSSEALILTKVIDDEGQVILAPKDKDGKELSEFDIHKKNLVTQKKVTIPYYWKQTAKMRPWSWKSSANGKWTPAAKAIIVNMSPETREWSADPNTGTSEKNQAIWVESSDSVGFSTGISVTARIDNTSGEDAVTFLSNYPPTIERKFTTQGSDDFVARVTSLEEIMDGEVRTKIQEVFAYEAASLDMNELRTKKREIMDQVKETVIPYFEERGITITSIGQFGGFTYENKKIQDAIDGVFEAQQDKEVAVAEASAAEERKLALQLKGEGQAQESIEIARGKAEAIKLEAEAESEAVRLVADAKAYELEKAAEDLVTYLALKQLEVDTIKAENWDGVLPSTSLGGDAGSFLYGMGKGITKK